MDYNININRLRYFHAVCQAGNVTRAAEELNISQPSVTMAIRELESDLGVLLFNRYKNRLQLTEEGKIVLEKTTALLQQMDLFFQEITDLGTMTGGKVRLGIPPIIGTMIIPRIYPALAQVHPDIFLEMFECTSTDALNMLDDNTVDVTILLNRDMPDRYEQQKIFETEICFCVRAGHPLSARPSVSCADLEGFPLAVLTSGSFHYSAVTEMFRREKVTPHIVLRSLELKTITRMVEQFDMGTFTYREIFENDPRIAVVPCKTPIPVTICAVWNRSNYMTRSAEKVIRFLASRGWVLTEK